jgi:hypothetical protein
VSGPEKAAGAERKMRSGGAANENNAVAPIARTPREFFHGIGEK